MLVEVWLTTRSAITRMPRSRRGADELDEVAERAQPRVDAVEVGDVVAVVAVGRRVEGHQPDAGDAEPAQVVDLLGEAAEVAAPVAVAVDVGLDVQAVDDGVLPPQVGGLGQSHALPPPQLGEDLLAERVEERLLLLPDVVQVDLVEAELGVLGEPGGVRAEVGRDVDDLRRPRSGGTCSLTASKAAASVEVPADRAAGRRCCATARTRAPRPRRSSGAQLRCTCSAQVAAAAGVAVGADHPPQRLDAAALTVISPSAHSAHHAAVASLTAAPIERGGVVGPAVDAGAVDRDQAVVADLLAARAAPG